MLKKDKGESYRKLKKIIKSKTWKEMHSLYKSRLIMVLVEITASECLTSKISERKIFQNIFNALNLHYKQAGRILKFRGKKYITYRFSKNIKYIEREEKLLRGLRKRHNKISEKKFHEEQGRLFGIPSCCIKNYIKATQKSEAEKRFKRYREEVLKKLTKSGKCIDWLCFIDWFPCSLNCRNSKKMANKRKKAIQEIDPSLIKEIKKDFIEDIKTPYNKE